MSRWYFEAKSYPIVGGKGIGPFASRTPYERSTDELTSVNPLYFIIHIPRIPSMKQHLNINIYGLVQGIFFRATAKEQADKLGITGFAQNLADGSVYIEAEGEKNALDKFIKWCNIGPSMAQVEKVVVTEDKLKEFSDFEIY